MTAAMTALRDLMNENILTLGMQADEVRRAADPSGIVRYQRVHAVRSADVVEAFSVPEAASEVRLLETPSEFAQALALVRTIKEAAGERLVSTFSLADLAARAESGWGSLRDVLTKLAAAGVGDVAECPVDCLDNLQQSVRLARDAGLLARRLTMARPPGDRTLELLERVRACCDALPGIERFAPLARQMPSDKPTTGYEDVRMIALARLALSTGGSPAPPSIEVDWLLYGPKLAQVALTFGADFLDAVPATSDPALGRRREAVQDVERNIRAAGFEPREYRPA